MGMTRLTESPEVIRIGKATASHMHPSATAFAIINSSVVGSSDRTHPFIFNALKAAAFGGFMGNTPIRTAAKDYDVRFYPRMPNKADLDWFQKNYNGEMGKLRRVTQSGRVWKNIVIDGKTVSAISFWAMRKEVAPATVELVSNAFKLGGAILVEYIDSKSPEPFTKAPTTVPMASKVAPKLTADQIIDILVKAHTNPMDLTPAEKKVVDEFRGNRKMMTTDRLSKYAAIPAQWKNARTIGDSVVDDFLARLSS